MVVSKTTAAVMEEVVAEISKKLEAVAENWLKDFILEKRLPVVADSDKKNNLLDNVTKNGLFSTPHMLENQISLLLDNLINPKCVGCTAVIGVFTYSHAHDGGYLETLIEYMENRHVSKSVQNCINCIVDDTNDLLTWITIEYLPKLFEMSSGCDAELLTELRQELGVREFRLGSALMCMIDREERFDGILSPAIVAMCLHIILIEEILIVDCAEELISSDGLEALRYCIAIYCQYIDKTRNFAAYQYLKDLDEHCNCISTD